MALTDIPIEWTSTGGDPLLDIEPKEGGALLSYALSTVAGTATYGTYEKESSDDLDRAVCPPPDVQMEGVLRFRTDDGTFDEEWPIDVSAATEGFTMSAAVAIEDFSTLTGTFSAELVTEEWQGAVWNPPRGSVFISWTEQGTSGAVGVEVHAEEQTLPDGGTVGFGMGIQLADWSRHE